MVYFRKLSEELLLVWNVELDCDNKLRHISIENFQLEHSSVNTVWLSEPGVTKYIISVQKGCECKFN